jgi:hypothetical protein
MSDMEGALAAAKSDAAGSATRLAHLEAQLEALQDTLGDVSRSVWLVAGFGCFSLPLSYCCCFVSPPGNSTLDQSSTNQGDQRDVVGKLLARVSTLQCAATEAEATRRKLHNQMVELRGNVSAAGFRCFIGCV